MNRTGIISIFIAVLMSLPGAAGAVKIRHQVTLNSDDQGKTMLHPSGVACGGGAVLLADTGNGRLLIGTFSDDRDLQLAAVKVAAIPAPLKAVRLASGDYLVTDGKSKQIGLVGGSDHSFKGYFEPAGMPGSTRVIVKAMATGPAGQIYLLDSAGNRVLVVDQQGQFLRQVEFADGPGFVSDLAVDESGTLYLVDGARGELLVAAAEDETFRIAGSPQDPAAGFLAGVAVSRSGLILVDRTRGRLLAAGYDGSAREYSLGGGFGAGELRYPADICLDGSGRLLVADQGNERLQVFTLQP